MPYRYKNKAILLKSAFIVVLSILVFSGCGGGEDRTYLNPEWRASVKDEVKFPLEEKVTLSVGIGSGIEAGSDFAAAWLEEKTNIKFEFVGLPSSPGDVLLGEMMRDGNLPDLMPESRIPLRDEYLRQLFVDFLEFPSLTPYFKRLIRDDEEYRNGILARLTFDGRLFSLGSFDRDFIPFSGVIAYRQDLFEKHNLDAGTWDDLFDSLVRLKQLYPDSYPFGGTFKNLLHTGPSWFGSGLDSQNLVYFDPKKGGWRFGPFEPEFEQFIRYFTELYSIGILSPDIFIGMQDETRRQLLTQKTFVALYPELTGPFFSYDLQEFGSVKEDGSWDGEGMWISSLPIPKHGVNLAGSATARLSTNVQSGWLIYNQSAYVSEAIALLDFLFSEEAAVAMALGPKGIAWDSDGGTALLKGEFLAGYLSSGKEKVRDLLAEKEIDLSFPLRGLSWSFFDNLGFPQFPLFSYYIAADIANNRPGIEIPLQPGLILSAESDFLREKAELLITLRTHIETQIAQFFIGGRSLSEYDVFKEELKTKGADKLLQLYNDNSRMGDMSDLLKEGYAQR